MLGAADMPIGCALTFSGPAGPPRPLSCRLKRTPKTQHGRDIPGHAATDRIWTLRRRLALHRLPLAMAGFAAEEQGLAHHRRDYGKLERFCDQERRLRPLPREKTRRIGGT